MNPTHLSTLPPAPLRRQIKLPFLKTLRGYLGAQTWRFLETYMQVRRGSGSGVRARLQASHPRQQRCGNTCIFCCAQVSDRTRWLVAQDWVRSFFFGRNISDI